MNIRFSHRRRGRPVNEGRRDEILELAGKLFCELGFESTTMDKIAKELGISKLTLYSRFATKEALLSAVIEGKCNQYMPKDLFQNGVGKSVDEFLFSIVFGLIRLLSSEDATSMEKLVMGAGQYREKLTHLFYEAGPLRIKREISEQLNRLNQEKQLVIKNPMLSTHCLAALIKGSDIVLRRTMRIPPYATEREMRRYCREVVRIFMAAHAP